MPVLLALVVVVVVVKPGKSEARPHLELETLFFPQSECRFPIRMFADPSTSSSTMGQSLENLLPTYTKGRRDESSKQVAITRAESAPSFSIMSRVSVCECDILSGLLTVVPDVARIDTRGVNDRRSSDETSPEKEDEMDSKQVIVCQVSFAVCLSGRRDTAIRLS